MQYRFYKENNKWYIDIPEWSGQKAELEMVEGADTMLDIISECSLIVDLHISLAPFESANVLEKLTELSINQNISIDACGGSYYLLRIYDQIEYNITMWLCDVTKYIFNEFPDKIYFKKI